MGKEYLKKPMRKVLRKITSVSLLRECLRFFSNNSLIPASIWKRLPVETEFSVRIFEDKYLKYVSTYGDAIGRALFWKGLNYWERETIPYFFKLAKRAEVVLDIGAYTGFYSILACLANQKIIVYAFEPVDRVRDILKKNISINNLKERCYICNEAVSDMCGIGKLHIPNGLLPSSASLNLSGFRGYEGEIIDVKLVAIDEFVKRYNLLKVDLVKIDVEGFEIKVLEGMKETLKYSQPVIIMEVIPETAYEEIDQVLREHQYLFFRLSKKGLLRVDKIKPYKIDKHYYENYLFINKGKSEILHYL